MKTMDEIMASGRILVGTIGMDGFNGVIHMPTWEGTIVCSIGAGWEHVSVSPRKKHITPSWDDMCRLKDIFFYDEEVAIQIHPKKSEYVNNMPNCLHLWRCTYKDMVLPPAVLVGIPDGMNREQFKIALKEAYALAGEEI